jgi:hypothetical protein
MLHSVWNTFFGCRHQRTTFPFTPKRDAAMLSAAPSNTYVACLDCGQELSYDWHSMQVGAPIKTTESPAQLQPIALPAFRQAATFVTSWIRR